MTTLPRRTLGSLGLFALTMTVRAALAQSADATASLSGIVSAQDKPMGGATVRIYSAGPKRGPGIL